MSDSRPLAVCADDYGLSPGVDRAILDLIGRGRISAVSCMTTSPRWGEAARELKSFQGAVDIGLHVTLVDERPLTSLPILAPEGRLPAAGRLIVRCLLRQLPVAEVTREVEAQYTAFIDPLGYPPDHVDGHLHAHAFPQIRSVVADLVQRRAPSAWVRDVTDSWPRIVVRGGAIGKSIAISAFGAGAPHIARRNCGFSGIRAFTDSENYPALFESYVRIAGPRPLVVAHPCASADDQSPHASARASEYAFLSSDAYPALLTRYGFAVQRLSLQW